MNKNSDLQQAVLHRDILKDSVQKENYNVVLRRGKNAEVLNTCPWGGYIRIAVKAGSAPSHACIQWTCC